MVYVAFNYPSINYNILFGEDAIAYAWPNASDELAILC